MFFITLSFAIFSSIWSYSYDLIYPIISRHVFVTVEPMVLLLACLSLVFLSLYMPAHMYVIYQMDGVSFGSKTIRPRQIYLYSFWIINLRLGVGVLGLEFFRFWAWDEFWGRKVTDLSHF